MNREELAARLLETFVTELEDQVGALNRHLLALEATPESADERRAVFRVMHTLKGAARAAGVPRVETACHRLETLLAELRDNVRPLDAETLAILFRGADALGDAAARLRAGQSLDDAPIAALTPAERRASPPQPAATAIPLAAAPVSASMASTSATTAAPSPPATSTTVPTTSTSVPVPSPTAAPSDAAAQAPEPPPAERTVVSADVRVRADQLDALLGAASRLLITGGRVETFEDALEDLRSTLTTALARRSTSSPATQLHELEDVLRTTAREVARLAREAADASRQLSTVTTDVGLGVRALRLRPFADVAAALPRVVRDAAVATGKEVNIEITGETVEADRTVLDEMREAVLHLVRNAVAHGIESTSERAARGKPAAGVVHVAATVVADHIVVTVADDGGGIDFAALRRELEAQGETVPADNRALVRRLFQGGVSTRAAADSIAGRGVGLDAVRAAMERVRGTVDVSWRAGTGTTFTLEAPVALATIRAVLVAVGPHVVAIPNAYVDRLVRLDPDDVRVADGRPVVTLGGGAPIPLVSLARLLGPPMIERARQGVIEAVVLAAGGGRVAATVDALADEDEIVVRPVLNRGRHELPFVSGAALLPSGKVAIVANAGALVAAATTDAQAATPALATPVVAEARRRVLVADDSITTRTLEQSVLETAGYEVTTAVDGADAWRVLQEQGADLVVSDVEMPRMDGFALCQAVRASTRFRELPVVLVTALETPDDRIRGIEAGADAYLAKSSFDQETLLDTVRQLIG